jgi:hypothetical protein
MLKMNTTVTTVKQTTVQITAEDIRKKFRLPETAVISLMVPGGGDWSSQPITLGHDVEFLRADFEVKKTREPRAKKVKPVGETTNAVEDQK